MRRLLQEEARGKECDPLQTEGHNSKGSVVITAGRIACWEEGKPRKAGERSWGETNF